MRAVPVYFELSQVELEPMLHNAIQSSLDYDIKKIESRCRKMPKKISCNYDFCWSLPFEPSIAV